MNQAGGLEMGTGLTGAQRHTAFMLRTHTIKGLRCTCHSLPRLQGPQRVHQLALPRRKCQRLAAHAQFAEPGMGLSEELKLAIDKYVSDNKVVLFMKGNRQFPQCGFSNTCVQILNMLNVPYETVNILEDERLRSGMKEYSQWPTFPQVYIDGEFFGGCDIMIEAYQNGQLVEILEAAANS